MAVTVVLGQLATKQLRIVPDHVVVKLHAWVRLVESRGLADYTESPRGDVEIVTVQEVTKYDY